MTVALIGKTELRCSVFVLLLLPAAVIFNRLDTLLIAASSLVAHESAHIIMAHRLGYAVEAMELRPFGCIARLAGSPAPGPEAAAIAAAGPLASLLLSLCSAGLAYLFGDTAGLTAPGDFAFFNLTLGLVNLLPVLPLDGGRLALSAVSRASGGKSRRRASLLFSIGGAAAGLAVAAIGVFAVIEKSSGMELVRAVSLVITGAFIAVSAAREGKARTVPDIRSRLGAPARLRRGSGMRVHFAALHKKSTVRDALMAVSGTGYAVVLVVDDDMRTLGTVDEGALMNEAVRGGGGARLGDIVDNYKRLK